jgi:MoxR-like ATPase
MASTDDWLIYKNVNPDQPTQAGEWKVPAPPWRVFNQIPPSKKPLVDKGPPAGKRPAEMPHSRVYFVADPAVKQTVTAAIRLRRPILVTGKPGTGKTSLAYSIAYELGLGPVLSWLITSRSTLREGLYEYDVLGRINDMNLSDKDRTLGGRKRRQAAQDIGRYIMLGPLGDALLPRARPRVLLIDEIDKCDIDLPGDLLHVFERGYYEIPELLREPTKEITVQRADGSTAVVHDGKVECLEFPVIVLTSNEEREFPPAFRRRCLQLTLGLPGEGQLMEIAAQKLSSTSQDMATEEGKIVRDFMGRRGHDGRLATDQLLNALFLRRELSGTDFDDIKKIVFANIDNAEAL